MLEKVVEQFFFPILASMFFICAFVYNIGYFGAFGDAFSYFLYIPSNFFDLLKTGFFVSLPVILFLVIFKPILIDPAFMGKFPSAKILVGISAFVLLCNLAYFAVFINSYDKVYSLISESLFYVFSIVCFFGVVYHFSKEKSRQLIFAVFLLSLIPISLLIGWVDAKTTLYSASSETKSQILLRSNKVVSAKILRSFKNGMFVISGSSTDINFISWDEIKEIKFKKVSGL